MKQQEMIKLHVHPADRNILCPFEAADTEQTEPQFINGDCVIEQFKLNCTKFRLIKKIPICFLTNKKLNTKTGSVNLNVSEWKHLYILSLLGTGKHQDIRLSLNLLYGFINAEHELSINVQQSEVISTSLLAG